MDEKTIARFWIKVDIRGPRECWPWKAYVGWYGYGLFGRGGKYLAHRVAFFLAHGHWPTPCGCHSCDNRLCCNPAHIWEGTKVDNVRDMDRKGRRVPAKGELHGMARLTKKNVIAIRAAVVAGETHHVIADRFDVSRQHVGDIASRKRWKHVK